MAYKKRTYKKKEAPRKTFSLEYDPSSRQVDCKEVARFMFTGEEPSNIRLWPLTSKLEHRQQKMVQLDACAGSGKTTTLLYILHCLTQTERVDSSGVRILLTSFANSIVRELGCYEWQFPGSKVQGLHSIGNGLLYKKFRPQLLKDRNENAIKTRKIVEKFDGFNPWECSHEDKAETWERVKAIEALVHFCKVTLTDWNNEEEVKETIRQYNIGMGGAYDDAMEILGTVMQNSIDQTNIIDFDDMLWLPIVYEMKFPRFDAVFGDEDQDYSKVQTEMISRMSDRGLLVGDNYQAIYGFTGADMQSIPNIIERFGAVRMPLDVNYRCAKAIIENVQGKVGEFKKDGTHSVINYWDNSPDGEAPVTIEYPELADKLKPGDFVICRKNAPLVPVCFSLIRRGVRCSIKGKRIDKRIKDLFNRTCEDCATIDDCVLAIEEYRELQHSIIIKKYRESAPQFIANLDDEIDCLIEFVVEAGSPDKVESTIESKFGGPYAKGDEVNLGSVHWSKGLENSRVFILEIDDFYTMHEGATQSDIDQRRNLGYIGDTRAKNELTYVLKRAA